MGLPKEAVDELETLLLELSLQRPLEADREPLMTEDKHLPSAWLPLAYAGEYPASASGSFHKAHKCIFNISQVLGTYLGASGRQ